MLLLTLRGTPTLYYGDEIGMRDVPIPAERVQDPWERNVPGIGVGRDPERTPMQWDDSANAGFCPEGVEPWLPVAGDFHTVNVAAQLADTGSMLSLYRRLIDLRRREPALQVGSYRPRVADGDILAYERQHAGRRLLVVLNLSALPRTWAPTDGPVIGRVLLSTHADRASDHVDGVVELARDEGVMIELPG
jgi:alpha-glucosidase